MKYIVGDIIMCNFQDIKDTCVILWITPDYIYVSAIHTIDSDLGIGSAVRINVVNRDLSEFVTVIG